MCSESCVVDSEYKNIYVAIGECFYCVRTMASIGYWTSIAVSKWWSYRLVPPQF